MASQPQEHVAVPNVTIASIDRAVKEWFDLTVDSHVQTTTGERQKVNVVFSSGERWVTSRQKQGFRDKNGLLILPVIAVRRNGIEANPGGMSSMGVETPNLQISRRISPKTNDLQNASNLRPPSQRLIKPIVYEVTTIPYPDFSVMTYEIQVQTQYVSQMNSIIEKIFHELDIQKSFVMPTDRTKKHAPIGEQFEERKAFPGGYFVGFFDPNIGSGDNFEEFTDQERIVRYTCNLRVPTYLILDPEGEKPSITKEYTAFEVQMGDESVEFVDDPFDIELIFSSRDPIAAWAEIQRKRLQK